MVSKQKIAMETTRIIEAYLEGSLNQEEKEKLEARASREENLRSLIQLHREVNESIRNTELFRLRDKLIEIKKRIIFIGLIGFHRIAALLIIFLSVYFIIRICVNQGLFESSLYDKYYTKYQPDVECRSSDKSISMLDDALHHYESGNYIACEQLLDTIILIEEDNFLAYFIQGLNYLELENPIDAITSFSAIPDHWGSPYSIHRDWYLALSFLKVGRYKESIALFKKLQAQSEYYSNNSKKIIRRMKF